jgi:predicted acetyltransferase
VFSYALYDDDQPASTATVFITENCLNVVCVATVPVFQRKGYAEAVMRHGLNEAIRATGLRRSVLHASEAGRPLYERMGYRTITKFTAWTSAHP